MAGRQGTSVRQRRVSNELRTLRQARKLSCEDVAAALGCSVSKISRMENGHRGLYPDDVAAVLGFYRVPAKQREELLQLVRDGAQSNWVRITGKLPGDWKDLIRIENDAVALCNYESLVIPGLLQTGDYARAVIQAGNRQLSKDEVDYLVTTRMARQALLSRFHPPSLSVIMEEMVLRRPVGEPGVMLGQLRHLLTMSERPHVEMRVVPINVGAHSGLEGPFMSLSFSDQPPLVYAETRGTGAFLEDEAVIRGARVAWQGLLAVALSPQDSARLVAEITSEMS